MTKPLRNNNVVEFKIAPPRVTADEIEAAAEKQRKREAIIAAFDEIARRQEQEDREQLKSVNVCQIDGATRALYESAQATLLAVRETRRSVGLPRLTAKTATGNNHT